MKKYSIIALFVALLSPLALVSCSESEDTVEEFPDWQVTNEAYFYNKYQEAIADETDGIDTIRCYSLESANDFYDYIVVEKLQSGTGSGCPMYTDSVLVNYRGRLLPSTSYPEGYVFDSSFSGDYNPATAMPVQMYVGDLIDGFSTALQYMHIGDYWRVYIPQQLWYGESETTSIPAYSTLVFDIALMAYYRAGISPGPWRSIEN